MHLIFTVGSPWRENLLDRRQAHKVFQNKNSREFLTDVKFFQIVRSLIIIAIALLYVCSRHFFK